MTPRQPCGSSSSLLSLQALGAILHSILTYSKQIGRDAKEGRTLFHAHGVNAFCSLMEREEQKQSVLPVLWLSLRAFDAELLSQLSPPPAWEDQWLCGGHLATA